jgi:hypothetical protein
VLVLILCVVHAAIRREGIPAVSASNMTAGELIAALQMAREVGDARKAEPGETPSEAKADGRSAAKPVATVDENITSLAPGAAHQIAHRRAAIFHHAATLSCLAVGPGGRSHFALDFRSAVMVTIAALAVDLAFTQGWIATPGPAATPAEIELGSPALNFPSLPSVLARGCPAATSAWCRCRSRTARWPSR